MTDTNYSIKFLLNLAKTQAILNNRFDRSLNGLSFTEFSILYYLSQAEGQKMRRVDIADKVGLTASGVTRLLLPMEKVHLVKSGPIANDARVRFVQLAAGGQLKLAESTERLEASIEDILSGLKKADVKKLADQLIVIGGKALMC